jgi:hypothetical protein
MLRVRATIAGFAGGPGLMTWYFGVASPDVTTATRLLTTVRANFIEHIRGSAVDTTSWTLNPDVDVIDAATGDITDTLSCAAPAVSMGAGGSGMAPPATAALLRLKTSLFIGGRRVRGRMYISPLATAAVDTSGQVSAAQHTALALAGSGLLGSLTSGDLWGVWHRPVSGAGGQLAQITVTDVPLKLAVLTSRRD